MAKEVWWELGRNLVLPVIVLLIFLGIYFGYEGGGFSKVKEISLGLKNYLPELGAQKDFGVEPKITKEQETSILSLKETIKRMQASGGENCFAQYAPLPLLGEEKGTIVELIYEQSGEATYFRVRGGAEGEEVIISLTETLKGIQPCVIAGKNGFDVSVSFEFLTALLNDVFPEPESMQHYLPVNRITLHGGDEENVLSYDGGNQQLSIQPQTWLFTPDGKNICFFPVGEDEEEGLKEGIFDVAKGSEITELRYLDLPLCSGGEYRIDYQFQEKYDFAPEKMKNENIPQE